MKSDLIRWVEVPIWNLQNWSRNSSHCRVWKICCWFQPIQIEKYISSNLIIWTSSETQIQMIHNHDSLDGLVPVQIQLGFHHFAGDLLTSWDPLLDITWFWTTPPVAQLTVSWIWRSIPTRKKKWMRMLHKPPNASNKNSKLTQHR